MLSTDVTTSQVLVAYLVIFVVFFGWVAVLMKSK
jgi:hypothetical protein